MGKRGMSAEEKRTVLLGIFHEFAEVFVLKDIEKLGSKKGVVLQSIKDVVQVRCRNPFKCIFSSHDRVLGAHSSASLV